MAIRLRYKVLGISKAEALMTQAQTVKVQSEWQMKNSIAIAKRIEAVFRRSSKGMV